MNFLLNSKTLGLGLVHQKMAEKVKFDAGGTPVDKYIRDLGKEGNACCPNSMRVLQYLLTSVVEEEGHLAAFLQDEVKRSYYKVLDEALRSAKERGALQEMMERTIIHEYIFLLGQLGVDVSKYFDLRFVSELDGETNDYTPRDGEMVVIIHHAYNHFWTEVYGFPEAVTTPLRDEFLAAARGNTKKPDAKRAERIRDLFGKEIIADAEIASKEQQRLVALHEHSIADAEMAYLLSVSS